MRIETIFSDVFDNDETCICHICKREFVEELMCEYVFDIDSNDNESSYNVCINCSVDENAIPNLINNELSQRSHSSLMIIRHM